MVVHSVPENSVVVGIPGRIISRSRTSPDPVIEGVEGELIPDPVGLSLESLFERLHELESEIGAHGTSREIRPSRSGIWSGEDFSI